MVERVLAIAHGEITDDQVAAFTSWFVSHNHMVVDEKRFEFSVDADPLPKLGHYFVVDGVGAEAMKAEGGEGRPKAIADVVLEFYIGEDIAPNLTRLDVQLRTERTLCIIKPDAAPKARDVVALIRKLGFVVIRMKKQQLTLEAAKEFYIEHEGRPFYERLTKFMSSGPIFVVAMERVGAIMGWRQVLGPTNTAVAKKERPGSVRALFGTDQTRNACHGSDGSETAERELKFFFPEISETTQNWNGHTDFESIIKDVLYAKGPAVDGYLRSSPNESLSEVLSRGLKELYETKPLEPVKWLGDYLIRNGEYKANIPTIEKPPTKTEE